MQKRVRFTEHSGQSRKQEYREERRKQDTSNDDCRCAALFFVQRQRKRQNKAGCNTEQSGGDIHPDADSHAQRQRNKQPAAAELPRAIEKSGYGHAHHSRQQVCIADSTEICAAVGGSGIGIGQPLRVQAKRVSARQLPERQQTA